MTTEKELYRLSREQFKEAFKYYYEAGKAEAIKQVLEIIDNWKEIAIENKLLDVVKSNPNVVACIIFEKLKQKLGELAK